MNQTLINALWITLIGMGLVFISLLLLWGLMELMVRLTSKTEKEEPPPEISPGGQGAFYAPCDDLTLLKMRAAAAAVAFAIASAARENGHRVVDHPVVERASSSHSNAVCGAWQSANRSSQINQNAALYNRKPRGNE